MANFVAYLVYEDPILQERFELVDMRGRVLKDKEDVMKWLMREAPLRPDLNGRRIDVVDADEKVGM